MKYLKTVIVTLLICFGPSVLIHFHDKALSEEQGIPFQHSQVGFLMTKYAPPAEQMIRTTVDPETFEKYVLPVMKQEAFGASVKSGIILFVLIWILEFSKIWQERERTSTRTSLYSRAFERTGGGFKYKRRK